MAKEISKLTSILRAFTGVITVDSPTWESRMGACDGCIYNSKNSDSSPTLTDVLRGVISSADFCKECGCNIVEKTSQGTEECPKSFWGKTMVEYKGGTNLDVKLGSGGGNTLGTMPYANNTVPVITLPDVEVGEKPEFTFDLLTKKGEIFHPVESMGLVINPSCGSCTKILKRTRHGDGSAYTIKGELNTANFEHGVEYRKKMNINFSLSTRKGTFPIFLKVKVKPKTDG